MNLRQETIGGGERDRTDDLLLAKQALSQLSYTPVGTVMGPRSGFRVQLETRKPELKTDKWWVWLDLNQRPHAYQACALTS